MEFLNFDTQSLKRYPFVGKEDPKTSEVIADSLMRMFIDGPEVSLSGSPTVSPTTAALCVSLPLQNKYFFS